MESKIPKEEFEKLPHSSLRNLGDRIFPLQPVYDDNGQWHSWWPYENKLIESNEDNLVEGNYFSNASSQPGGIKFTFINHIYKRASRPGIYQKASSIMNKLHNLSINLVKLDIFFDTHKSGAYSILSIGRMGATELEHIFLTCRSLLDLLQKIISIMLKKVKLAGFNDLPESFSRMLIKNWEHEKFFTCSEIQKRFGIPYDLAKLYHRQSEFFVWLKRYREGIAHHGQESPLVFVTEKGLAVSQLESPFSDMKIWTDSNTCDSNLGSLSSVACHVIRSTIQALEDIFEYFSTRSEFPEDITPGYDLYVRGEHIARLDNLDEIIKNPW